MQSGPRGARAQRERWYRRFLGDKQLSAANEARAAVPISLALRAKRVCIVIGVREGCSQPLLFMQSESDAM
jgi:hypothetical protein